MKVGFVVNPIAGMGGRVGLKGTDGVYKEAVEKGAEPVAKERGERALQDIKGEHVWLTAGGAMGEELLEDFFPEQDIRVIYRSEKDIGETTNRDTQNAVKTFMDEDVDIILFCGGDGTARDIFELVDKKIPLLGIPSGVKMHSGVFGINPEASAQLFNMYAEGKASLGTVEIMDLDEDKYRKGDWEFKLHGDAVSVYEPHYIQLGKQSFRSVDEEEMKYDIASYIIEEMEHYPNHMFVLGPGSTTAMIQEQLELEHTILGVDVLKNKEIVVMDASEAEILEATDGAEGVKIVVSVIGNQGFFLGRGNQQISPSVVREAGLMNIYILATPSKLKKTPVLRADTGDTELDKEIHEKGYIRVVTGFREYRLVKVEA